MHAAARRAGRGGRALVGWCVAQLATVLRNLSPERRLIAASALGLLVVVTCVSVGLLALRGGGRPAVAAVRRGASSGPAFCDAPTAPPTPANAPVPAIASGENALVAESIAPDAPELATAPATASALGDDDPDPLPPPHRTRKHAKPAARRSGSLKAAGKAPARPLARPVFAR
jgi:hypothetical protein